jgi:mono/diheme cytochrome c family protein
MLMRAILLVAAVGCVADPDAVPYEPDQMPDPTNGRACDPAAADCGAGYECIAELGAHVCRPPNYMIATPQREGDPVRGYDALVNGNYFPCGVPQKAFDLVNALGLVPSDGAPVPNELGRTGRNAELPYFFTAYTSKTGVPMVTVNCLFCHGGRVDGDLIVGLGDNAQDFTYPESVSGGMLATAQSASTLFLSADEAAEVDYFLDRFGVVAPRIQMNVKGSNPGDLIPRILGAYRKSDTLAWQSAPNPMILPTEAPAPTDVPPWWRVARKNQLYYVGEGYGDHARLLMSAAMYCAEDTQTAAAFDDMFVDVVAYIKSIEPPKYRRPLDAAKVATGKAVFNQHCTGCHGTYGQYPSYPNRWFPLDEVGTDPLLARQESSPRSAAFNVWYDGSWYGTAGPLSRIQPKLGYVAPPLDGVWATAPFLHNGSVPSLAALLDSSKRPRYWTRNFGKNTFDPIHVGVDAHELASPADAFDPHDVYDTTVPGQSAAGHTYGDGLTADERLALIEYIKTL